MIPAWEGSSARCRCSSPSGLVFRSASLPGPSRSLARRFRSSFCWLPCVFLLLRALKRAVVQDGLALLALNLTLPVFGDQQAAGVLLRAPLADQPHVKFTHQFFQLLLVIADPMHFLHPEGGEAQRIVRGRLDGAQVKDRGH